MLQYLTFKEVRLTQQGLSQGASEGDPGACRETEFPMSPRATPQSTMETYTPPATASYVMSAGKTLLPCRHSRQLLHGASGVICSQDLTSGLVYTC